MGRLVVAENCRWLESLVFMPQVFMPQAYVNEYYITKMWRETYKDGNKHVQEMMGWPRLNTLAVLPPPWRRGNPERPSNYARRKRRNESGSSKTTLTRHIRIMTC